MPKFKKSANSKYKSAMDSRESKAEMNFVKAYGQAHPINEINSESKRKVQIVYDDEDDSDEKGDVRNKKYKGDHLKRDNDSVDDLSKEEEFEEECIDDIVIPYQKLLNDTAMSSRSNKFKLKFESKDSSNDNDGESCSDDENSQEENDESDQVEDGDSDEDSRQENSENNPTRIDSYSMEVLCKDNLEEESSLVNDPFHLHFENNLEEKLVEKLKANLSNNLKLKENEKRLYWSSLGELVYTPPLEETKIKLEENKDIKTLAIKQRILERLNESIDTVIGENNKVKDSKYNLDKFQTETLNIISSYVDFYNPNVDIKSDTKNKFTYAIHALNHVLKTRSRIIAHNDKIKQTKSNKSNVEVEHRDQGLTRPKVLIVVPFRKFALKLVNIFISLIMRKSEEFVSNKKRFQNAFGPVGEEDSKKIVDSDDDIEQNIEEEEAKDMNPAKKFEDFDFLFSGNNEDHFKIGMSVSKKSLKLYTEFYSSDIIIASPLGLKSVIGIEGDLQQDHDFLSSIELLIIDNSDVLMMQNWDHVLTIFEHLHLQPKKSHDVDFSRVRNWLLDGHSRFYRQTLIFSRIPAPPINSISNKYCQNYAGKCQINLMKNVKFQIGTICQIGFQLAQVFHKIDCDSPIDAPNSRFNFFVEKILPQFRDEMMSHTLIFIPSYFDFVKIRNHFKKNDVSSMNVSEYSDNKSIDRARYLFYHGKVHFMLLTERFHFYKRYKIRGINHIIFYELPHYPEYYSNFCNYLPDVKRSKNGALENFSCTVLYSNFDAQKLCAVVGHQRATHMINSDKSVHMFMVEDK